MRRRSLFGPIVILVIGVMFLVHNFRPDIEVWHLFGQYWPLLLIFLGVMKLLQAFTPADPNLPPRPIITGGEVFLIILLCIVGAAIFKGGRLPIDDWPIDSIIGQEYTYSQSLNQSVSEAQPEIVVNNAGGDVAVEGADVKAIEVKAEKRIRTINEDEAKRAEERAPVTITKTGNSYVVRCDHPSSGSRRLSYKASLEIRVPRGSIVRVDTKRGDVKVRDVTGTVNVTLDRGNVELTDIGSNAKLDIRRGGLTAQRIKGGIELDGRGDDIQVSDVDGDVIIRGEYGGSIAFANVKKALRFTSNRTEMEIQKLPGKIDMSIGSLTITEPGGGVTIKTSAKDIRVDDFDGPVQITNRDAGVELSTKKAIASPITVENKSGRIELALPHSASFQVDASSRRGDVSSEFSEIATKHDNDNGTMFGNFGKNGPTVKLYTTFGHITLKKRE